MSWRVIAAIMIAVFVIVAIMTMVAQPIRDVGDSIVDASGSNSDVQQQRDMGIRAFENLGLLLIGGLLAWGGWRVLRRELTRGQL